MMSKGQEGVNWRASAASSTNGQQPAAAANKKPLQRQTGRSSLMVRNPNTAPTDSRPTTGVIKKTTTFAAAAAAAASRTTSYRPIKTSRAPTASFEVFEDAPEPEPVETKPAPVPPPPPKAPSVFERLYHGIKPKEKEKEPKRVPLAPRNDGPLALKTHIATTAAYRAGPSSCSEVRADFSAIVRVDSKKDDRDDEAGSSVYSSALEEVANSDYFSALPPNERELAGSAETHPDYVQDIWLYMCNCESRGRPRRGFMSRQKDLQAEMRTILVDWLVDVTQEYGLEVETLHLAVSLVDRLLSVNEVSRDRLQLVGSTAMLIASKFEEIYPPELREFVYITDDSYTESQILRMERVMLNSLNFEIGVPTSQWFATRLLSTQRAPRQTRHYASFALELALLDADLVVLSPSRLAAAAVCLANTVTGLAPWPKSLESLSGIALLEVVDYVSSLRRAIEGARGSRHRAVVDKYADARFDAVSSLPVPMMPEL